MRLGQIRWNGSVTAAMFEGDCARPIPGYTLAGLILRSEAESTPLTELAGTADESDHDQPDSGTQPNES